MSEEVVAFIDDPDYLDQILKQRRDIKNKNKEKSAKNNKKRRINTRQLGELQKIRKLSGDLTKPWKRQFHEKQTIAEPRNIPKRQII